MKGNNNGRVFYLCFYSDSEVEDKIITYPSVKPKIDYVASKIKELGKQVIIVSVAPSVNGKFLGFEKEIDALEKHIYLSSVNRKCKFFQKIETLKCWNQILRFLKNNLNQNDILLVYHSLYNRVWLKRYKTKYKGSFILEIEDVFSSLSLATKKFEKQEWKLFDLAESCICINDIVYNKIERVSRKMISYGSYQLPPLYNRVEREKIKIVYAGVIEQERKAAFLAVQAMRYLPACYELSVLGFGEAHNIEALQTLIDELNEEKGTSSIKFEGRKSGQEYSQFLQNCDIALSTHAYDESNIESANHTFPSKILVYMANGLRVVAQHLEVLEKSAIGELLYFYEKPNPEAIANAIKGIDITAPYDGRERIKELDKKFTEDIKNLLEKM